jgi:hypothetical protein
MRLALILVSILVILASGYVAWWIMTQADYEWEAPMRNGDEITGYTTLTPEHEALTNLARYGSFLIPLLGILLLVTNISKKETGRTGLVMIIATEALSAILAFCTTSWGFPSKFTSHGVEQTIVVFGSPGPDERITMWISALAFAAVLALLGLGIAQLVKYKKAQSS